MVIISDQAASNQVYHFLCYCQKNRQKVSSYVFHSSLLVFIFWMITTDSFTEEEFENLTLKKDYPMACV